MVSDLIIVVLALVATALAIRCHGLATLVEQDKQRRIADEVRQIKNPESQQP